jgi:hypothetical protein
MAQWWLEDKVAKPDEQQEGNLEKNRPTDPQPRIPCRLDPLWAMQ